MTPTGDFLGDLADELAVYDTGSFIQELAAAGLNNYALKCKNIEDDTFDSCKVKGITFNL